MRFASWLLGIAIAIAALAAVAFFWMTRPGAFMLSELPAHEADVANGEYMFWAGGCASCHATPEQEDKTLLGGGLALETPYGVFRVPNITPDAEHGIGGWSALEFVNAMKNGVSPEGQHLYPAFPYGSYHKLQTGDVIDMKAYLDTLQPSDNAVAGHSLSFPYNFRRGLGLWKWRYLSDEPIEADLPDDPAVRRGQYLVEAAGLMPTLWLAGAPNPSGRSRIPNITPHEDGISDWSREDIAYALKSGLTPEFDSFGGSMAEVVETLSHLTDEDADAIAAYLKAIPARTPSPCGRRTA